VIKVKEATRKYVKERGVAAPKLSVSGQGAHASHTRTHTTVQV